MAAGRGQCPVWSSGKVVGKMGGAPALSDTKLFLDAAEHHDVNVI